MRFGQHRSESAFWIALNRCPDYTIRAALTKSGLIVVLMIAMMVGGARWWAWLIIPIAIVAEYSALMIGVVASNDEVARSRLSAWIFQSVVSARDRRGIRWNIPGVLETLLVIPLATTGPWSMPNASVEWRLCATAAALGFIGSFLCTTALDPACYDPLNGFPTTVETARKCLGIIGAGVALMLLVPAPWPGLALWVVIGMTIALAFAVQLRIQETDRTMIWSTRRAEQREEQGREEAISTMHASIGTPLDVVVRLTDELRAEHRQLFDAARSAAGWYRELVELRMHPLDVTSQWPGLLIADLRLQLSRWGTMLRPSVFPDEPMKVQDREIAQLVLQDLAANVAKAEASYCSVVMTRTGDTYRISVTDDGRPIDKVRWLRPGGGLDHLRTKYAHHIMTFTYEETVQTKTVHGSWSVSDTKGL